MKQVAVKHKAILSDVFFALLENSLSFWLSSFYNDPLNVCCFSNNFTKSIIFKEINNAYQLLNIWPRAHIKNG